MITHVVIIWLAPTQWDQVSKLRDAAHKFLSLIPHAKNFLAGVPVPMDRSVVDGSYQLA